jgi:hypothetical protein
LYISGENPLRNRLFLGYASSIHKKKDKQSPATREQEKAVSVEFTGKSYSS